jgi:hypothetical protein
VTALEHPALCMPPELVDEGFLRRLQRRKIGWLLGLQRA